MDKTFLSPGVAARQVAMETKFSVVKWLLDRLLWIQTILSHGVVAMQVAMDTKFYALKWIKLF